MSKKEMGPNLPQAALALSTPANQRSFAWDWGFHTVRGGIDLGEVDFPPRVVGVVDI